MFRVIQESWGAKLPRARRAGKLEEAVLAQKKASPVNSQAPGPAGCPPPPPPPCSSCLVLPFVPSLVPCSHLGSGLGFSYTSYPPPWPPASPAPHPSLV